MKTKIVFILGTITGATIFNTFKISLTYLENIDYRPLYPYLIVMNEWSIFLTTKNIAELGIILILVIPMIIFVIVERRKKY